jgi:DNA-nicking Smr family endonuclease
MASDAIANRSGPEAKHEPRHKARDEPDEKDAALFLKAMADVKPPAWKNRSRAPAKPTAFPFAEKQEPDADALLQLKNLVKFGKGFVVADTPEYIESCGYDANPEVTRRLHRGDFSIQAHLDLHGLGVTEAQAAFEGFLTDAIKTGKRAVLIIHGRGLSSPTKPVLKTKVIQWMTCSPWRKWIIAFSSARLCDGGAGATYLLLRRRPLTKALRKREAGKWKRLL